MGRLGDTLVAAGVIDEAQLREALKATARTGQRLGEALVASGQCTEQAIAGALAAQLGLPQATAADLVAPADGVRALIGAGFARGRQVVPLRLEDEALVVAVADPADQDLLDELRFATGHPLKPLVATPSALAAALETLYGPSADAQVQALRREVAALRAELAALKGEG
ncbi:MAG: hypothetical protein H6702_23350 [Myxococcales bacterium]|nr:hypothetical protein [Myxococcales bacterium]